jgi:hypothetical protein
LDEAGDLSFKPEGTCYFILTSLARERPFTAYQPLGDLKSFLAERGLDIEYFDASEDAQALRNLVFQIINRLFKDLALASTRLASWSSREGEMKTEFFRGSFDDQSVVRKCTWLILAAVVF